MSSVVLQMTNNPLYNGRGQGHVTHILTFSSLKISNDGHFEFRVPIDTWYLISSKSLELLPRWLFFNFSRWRPPPSWVF